MKPYTLLLLLSISTFFACHQSSSDLESKLLKLTMVEGYGPFSPGFGSLSEDQEDDAEWGKIYQPLKGIPTHWQKVSKSMVWLDAHQLVYQQYIAGNITPAWYKELQKSWKWKPDTLHLSKAPIKCYIYTVRGYNPKTKKWEVLVDTDNDLDVADEKVVEPEPINWMAKDAFTNYKSFQLVHYEVYRDGKVVPMQIPMVIRMLEKDFVYNFPQHAKTIFEQDGKTYEIFASSSHFTRPSFETTQLAYLPLDSGTKKLGRQVIVSMEENIEIGGKRYKYKGVDVYSNTLLLEPVKSKRPEYSLQVGYPFQPFTAKEFTTGRSISLKALRGKYVYIDFWGTWCKGCVEEMPTLNELYRQLDTTRFAFIGIAEDEAENLRRFIDKTDVKWPQILSDSTNKLVDTYDVPGFPTSVLLSPEGNVIARDLRGDRLKAKLKELSR